jgi:hypothetical protein
MPGTNDMYETAVKEVLHAGRDVSRLSHLFRQRCGHPLSLDAVTASQKENPTCTQELRLSKNPKSQKSELVSP